MHSSLSNDNSYAIKGSGASGVRLHAPKSLPRRGRGFSSRSRLIFSRTMSCLFASNATAILYFAPFRRLQSAHKVHKFFMSFVPPRATGFLWSISNFTLGSFDGLAEHRQHLKKSRFITLNARVLEIPVRSYSDFARGTSPASVTAFCHVPNLLAKCSPHILPCLL